QVLVFGHEPLELRAAEPFAEAGGHDDGAALLDDGQRARKALDRLVPGGIEWVTGTRSHDDVARLGHRHFHDIFDEADALLPGLDHVAGADPGYAPLAVETDVDDEIAAGHQGDASVLFVDRVAVEDATVRLRVLQKARAVPDLYRFEGRDSGTDDL